MVEMTTGQRSFNNYKFDIDLAVMICNGLRPKFAPGTPDCYVELANQCMNSDPDKRPNVNEIITKLNGWLNIIVNKKIIESDIENESGIENKSGVEHESDIKSASDIKNESIVENEGENRIRKQFLENDEVSKTLPMITEKLNDMYTSKPYYISEISAKFSKTAGIIEVPNDI
ncbi:hypothetical protein C2G38_2126511 [Gigaspora rosea]|uniref:Serine-threonine/tyrosine-protein kinase catalytic domain-containing protein n=1 Tax=Gigaspora rosea TaxID=44941 RepID=A0A397TZI8_9GLOM|nr:hypothetical protein C2G38_2126511 [Gigaspora rosea]